MTKLKRIDNEYLNSFQAYEESEIELSEFMTNAFNYKDELTDFDYTTISIITAYLEMAFKKCLELKQEALEYLLNNNHSL